MTTKDRSARWRERHPEKSRLAKRRYRQKMFNPTRYALRHRRKWTDREVLWVLKTPPSISNYKLIAGRLGRSLRAVFAARERYLAKT